MKGETPENLLTLFKHNAPMSESIYGERII
jgi:hypothetical protein